MPNLFISTVVSNAIPRRAWSLRCFKRSLFCLSSIYYAIYNKPYICSFRFLN